MLDWCDLATSTTTLLFNLFTVVPLGNHLAKISIPRASVESGRAVGTEVQRRLLPRVLRDDTCDVEVELKRLMKLILIFITMMMKINLIMMMVTTTKCVCNDFDDDVKR